jgi:predicted dehydrogenase
VAGAAAGTARHRIEVEDSVVAALRFSSGAPGTILATTAAAPGFPHRVEIYGTRGGAQIEGETVVRWEGDRQRPRAEPTVAVDAGAGGSPTGINFRGHQRVVEDFVAAIRDRREPWIDGVEGRRSLALVLAIYGAAGLGCGEHTGRAGRASTA